MIARPNMNRPLHHFDNHISYMTTVVMAPTPVAPSPAMQTMPVELPAAITAPAIYLDPRLVPPMPTPRPREVFIPRMWQPTPQPVYIPAPPLTMTQRLAATLTTLRQSLAGLLPLSRSLQEDLSRG